MLKTRIIPTLLWKDVGLVKGQCFDSSRRVGSVLPAIRIYNIRDVDEIILLDISATAQNRAPDYESIEEIAAECFVPLVIGGGVSSIEHISGLLRCGADKISINTSGFWNPKLIHEASSRFGAQCIVGSIDFKRNNGTPECYTNNGTVPTSKCPVRWAQELEKLGVGEILLTSIDRDGTMLGYDLEITKEVANAVGVPVIASGGAGCYQDLMDALVIGGATAVAAASIFHFTESTPLAASDFLRAKGIPVRKSA